MGLIMYVKSSITVTLLRGTQAVKFLVNAKSTRRRGGPYVWTTYQEVYDAAIHMGSAIRSCGVDPGDCCGVYGSNCPQWIIAMEVLMQWSSSSIMLKFQLLLREQNPCYYIMSSKLFDAFKN